jgi:predicted nuclease of predicted toxin-antitoxin system
MKVLLDANISWKLIKVLTPAFDECAHVDSIGLDIPASDKDI